MSCFARGLVNDGVWHNIVGVYDGTNLKIYLDGALKDTEAGTGGFTNNTNGYNIGTNGTGASVLIDDGRIYNRALSAGEVAALAQPGNEGDLMYNNDYHLYQFCDGTNWIAMGPTSAGGGGSSAPTSGLVGYWKLDEASGTSAADSSGNGNTATVTPNATGFWVAGKINNAGNFNGTTQYVDAANPSNFNFERTQPFTLAAWVNRTSTTGEDDIIAKMGPSTVTWVGYSLFFDNNGTTTTCNGVGCTSNCVAVSINSTLVSSDEACVVAKTTPAGTGAWHHIVATYDGSSTAAGIKIYVDGSAQTTTASPDTLTASILTATDLKIGTDIPGQSDEFVGKLDDVRVYNRVLSAAEVTQLYNYAGGGCTSPAGNEGDMFYNNAYNAMQYCNGTSWVRIGQ